MRLVYPEYGVELEFAENQVLVWAVEQPRAFAKVTGELWRQIQGADGGFILSEADKIYNMSKKMEFIVNPISISCNDRKIISKLYQELQNLASNELLEKTSDLNSRIITYLDELVSAVPYPLEFQLELDLAALMKGYGVTVEDRAENLLEKLIDYLKIMRQICHMDTFVILNLKQYLDKEELQSLYEFVFYEKINLLILEGKFTGCSNNEKYLILDQDLCIIEGTGINATSQVE